MICFQAGAHQKLNHLQDSQKALTALLQFEVMTLLCQRLDQWLLSTNLIDSFYKKTPF